MWLYMVLDPRKQIRFLKFSFSEIYGNAMAEVMVDNVKDLLYKLYNFYSSIHSPNVQEQSGVRGQNWKVMLVIHM